MKIGILALQGDFEAHWKALRELDVDAILVRHAWQLGELDGLIIPGGESTTMLKLMMSEGLFEALREFGQRKPIFGTCAGAILLARRVTNPEQESLGLMDIEIERNAYGRQIDSRVAPVRLLPPLSDEREGGQIEGVFIRAPIIRRVGPTVRVLATYAGDPVLVEDSLHLAATFHPELSRDRLIHRQFIQKVGGLSG